MKYLLLFCGTEEGARFMASLTLAEREQRFAEVGAWLTQHSARIGARNRLESPETATTLRFPMPSGEPLVTDGPFMEGKEVIGGYCEIEVEDLDEALRMAKTWPARGTVEIRPVQQ